jgi:hypothetical protein
VSSVCCFLHASRHIVAGNVGTFALLLRHRRWCLGLDVLDASTSPKAIELRAAVVAFHGFEANKVTVLDAFVAVGVLTATSRTGWFAAAIIAVLILVLLLAKREAPTHCSGLVTVVDSGCLVDQGCWYLILRGCVRCPNLSAQYFASPCRSGRRVLCGQLLLLVSSRGLDGDSSVSGAGAPVPSPFFYKPSQVLIQWIL